MVQVMFIFEIQASIIEVGRPLNDSCADHLSAADGNETGWGLNLDEQKYPDRTRAVVVCTESGSDHPRKEM